MSKWFDVAVPQWDPCVDRTDRQAPKKTLKSTHSVLSLVGVTPYPFDTAMDAVAGKHRQLPPLGISGSLLHVESEKLR